MKRKRILIISSSKYQTFLSRKSTNNFLKSCSLKNCSRTFTFSIHNKLILTQPPLSLHLLFDVHSAGWLHPYCSCITEYIINSASLVVSTTSPRQEVRISALNFNSLEKYLAHREDSLFFERGITAFFNNPVVGMMLKSPPRFPSSGVYTPYNPLPERAQDSKIWLMRLCCYVMYVMLCSKCK